MLYDLIIIGGGPAGITAGIYAARKKLNTLLIAKDFFGQTAKTGEIDNWPGSPKISGGALMQNFEKHLKNFALGIKENQTVISVKQEAVQEGASLLPAGRSEAPSSASFVVRIESGESFEAKALVVCSGASPKRLGVPGEDKFTGKGVSFCSLCDAPFFQGKNVAVAGGGNSALEAALDLAKYADKIYLLEAGDFLQGDPLLQDSLKQTGKVEIRLNQEIKEIQGKTMVEGAMVFDRSSQKTEIIAVAGVFVEIGWTAQSDFLGDLLSKNERGEIIADSETGQTSLEGVWAAGDCVNAKYKQILLASASGARAALSAYEYLNKLKVKNDENNFNKISGNFNF